MSLRRLLKNKHATCGILLECESNIFVGEHMSAAQTRTKILIIPTLLRSIAVAAFFFYAAATAAEAPQTAVASLSREKALELGERMYRTGLLPSGEPLTAFVQGDIPVEGTTFTCVSCHVRSGIGSYEGGVVTLPTNGEILYRPFKDMRRFVTPGVGMIPYFKLPKIQAPPRPAYTDTTLAAVLRTGIDPAGRQLDYVMPRYQLSDPDMNILIFYLKALSAQTSPGVTNTTIRFATVITDEVGPKERQEMLSVLNAIVIARNNAGKSKMDSQLPRWAGFSEDLSRSRRKISLAVWDLKGPPGTWRSQLEQYYRKEPVFALLAGITTGEWKPVHEFSEANKIPCLFPITDFPVISSTDWYTQYISKGYYQEGEAVARFLGNREELSPEKAIVQLYQDTREGRALADGFRETWKTFDRRQPVDCVLKKGNPLTKEYLQKALSKEKSAILLLWAGAEAYAVLEAVAADANKPDMIYLSSSLLKDGFLAVPETVRAFTYITYPYRLGLVITPGKDLGKGSMGVSKDAPVPVATRNVAQKTGSSQSLLPEIFMMMMTNFYRDYMLDIIGMCGDMKDSPYERLSFGPGQRYASKGCYIVQLTPGANPAVVKKSDWVIH